MTDPNDLFQEVDEVDLLERKKSGKAEFHGSWDALKRFDAVLRYLHTVSVKDPDKQVGRALIRGLPIENHEAKFLGLERMYQILRSEMDKKDKEYFDEQHQLITKEFWSAINAFRAGKQIKDTIFDELYRWELSMMEVAKKKGWTMRDKKFDFGGAGEV